MPKLNTTTSGIITATLTADSSPTLDLQQNGVTIRTLGESQLVLGTSQSTATGATLYDFSGIPSWAKRITVLFAGVSINSTSGIAVQIGDSGGIETTGYTSGVVWTGGANAIAGSTTQFLVTAPVSNAEIYSGSVTLTAFNATNTWIESGILARESTGGTNQSGGTKTLSGILDRIRIVTVNGTDTFDAGSVNIMWE